MIHHACPILVQKEEHPHNPSAVANFAYFKGTPTAGDLLAVQERYCEGWTPPDGELQYLLPERKQNEITHPDIERWCLWD